MKMNAFFLALLSVLLLHLPETFGLSVRETKSEATADEESAETKPTAAPVVSNKIHVKWGADGGVVDIDYKQQKAATLKHAHHHHRHRHHRHRHHHHHHRKKVAPCPKKVAPRPTKPKTVAVPKIRKPAAAPCPHVAHKSHLRKPTVVAKPAKPDTGIPTLKKLPALPPLPATKAPTTKPPTTPKPAPKPKLVVPKAKPKAVPKPKVVLKPKPVPKVTTPKPKPVPKVTTTTVNPKHGQCVETVKFSCNAEASQSKWNRVCMSKSKLCSGCAQCRKLGSVECPDKWFSFKGHCYQTSMKKFSYYDSRTHCQKQGGKLISINSKEENDLAHDLCHNQPDPITYPKKVTRTSCWIGLYEKPGTGTVDTPQDKQIWLWLDGTTPKSNGYTHWATWPGLGNGKGDGNNYFEPNNQRTKASKGFNVRHAILNQPEGKFAGKWYDKPSETFAHPLCEVDPNKSTKAKLMYMPPGFETKVPLDVEWEIDEDLELFYGKDGR